MKPYQGCILSGILACLGSYVSKLATTETIPASICPGPVCMFSLPLRAILPGFLGNPDFLPQHYWSKSNLKSPHFCFSPKHFASYLEPLTRYLYLQNCILTFPNFRPYYLLLIEKSFGCEIMRS